MRSLQISISFSLFLFLSRLHSGTGQKNVGHVLLSSLIYDRVWDHVGVLSRFGERGTGQGVDEESVY